jgi:putative phosphoribosyl transferase
MLAQELAGYEGRTDVIVLALPRGGVPVGYEVAAALAAPLDVFVVRKLGAPHNEELAIGALASDGICVLDRETMAQLRVPENQLAEIIGREMLELERRDRLYRRARPFPDVTGHVVIVVDDGLATGATMRVAVEALRQKRPAQVIAAAPVASVEACAALREIAGGCVCVASPQPFYGVGRWYEDFSQTTDREVISLLDRAAYRPAAVTAGRT